MKDNILYSSRQQGTVEEVIRTVAMQQEVAIDRLFKNVMEKYPHISIKRFVLVRQQIQEDENHLTTKWWIEIKDE